MNYKIKVDAEPHLTNNVNGQKTKYWNCSFLIDDSIYKANISDSFNVQEVKFMDESSIDEVLFEYEKKELVDQIKKAWLLR